VKKSKVLLSYAALICFLILLPLLVKDPRWMHLMIMTGIYIMLAGGLRLIMSTGQVSFAHAGFWAIGAYTSTLLVMKLGLSFWLALPLSGLMGAVAAALVGYPCLRLQGPYFFLVTIAFGEVLRLVMVNWNFLGGDAGISNIPYPNPIAIGGLAIQFSYRSVHYYYLMLVGLLCSLFIFYRLERSRFGLTCSGVRGDADLSASLGVEVMRYKMTAFVVASLIASMAGSFFAHYVTYISPGFFTFNESLILLIMVVVGGSESITGVIIGVILINALTEATREFASYEIVIYGTALVLIFRFSPGGILYLWTGFVGGRRSMKARPGVGSGGRDAA
jgi:branched-chain amino acid transport system permease protein